MKRKLAYVNLITYLSVVLAVAGMYFYVGYAIDQDNKRTCRLYEKIIQPTPDTPLPPRDSRAWEVRQELIELMKTYDCDKR